MKEAMKSKDSVKLGTVRSVISAVKNQEIDLKSFINASELIFTSTKGLSLFINANEIKQISGYEFPISLVIQPNPPSLAIQRYKPLP